MYKSIALLVVLTYLSLCLADDALTCESPVDNEANFYRPCSPLTNYTCIAEYLAAHSNCTLNVGSMTEPHYRKESDLFFPYFNMSLVQTDIYLSGLKGEIVEFYVNNETDKLVMAVNYTNLIINSTTATMTYHRLAQEPAVTVASSYEVFPSLTITAVFDEVSEGLFFNKAYTHVYIPIMPNITFTDSVYYYPADSARIEAMWTEFTENLAIVIQEAFMSAAQYYFWELIEHDFCNFGIENFN